MLARNFYSHQCYINKSKLLRVSRKNYDSQLSSDHILYDLSHPYDIDLHQDLVSQIRSAIDLKQDTVICLFAWSGTPRTSADPNISEAFRRDNYNIVNNFSYLINDLDISQIIFLSSAGGIYSDDETSIHDESSIPRPATPYGCQKLEAEAMLERISDKYKVPLCIYRVSCAYGFNEFCPDQGVLNKWIFDGLLRGEIDIYNSLESELNFISYEQISVALELGIDLCLSGIFNVCTSSSISLMDIYNLVVHRIPNIRLNILGTKKRALNVDCSRFSAASGREFEPAIENDFPTLYATICSFINKSNVKNKSS